MVWMMPLAARVVSRPPLGLRNSAGLSSVWGQWGRSSSDWSSSARSFFVDLDRPGFAAFAPDPQLGLAGGEPDVVDIQGDDFRYPGAGVVAGPAEVRVKSGN